MIMSLPFHCGGSDGHDDDGDNDVIIIISHSAIVVYRYVSIMLLLL